MPLKKKFPEFQTAEWWIEQLKAIPNQKAVVRLATASHGPAQCMLSIYGGDEKRPTIYIDVGEPE